MLESLQKRYRSFKYIAVEAVVAVVGTPLLHQLPLLGELLHPRHDEHFHQQQEEQQQRYVSWIKYSASSDLSTLFLEMKKWQIGY